MRGRTLVVIGQEPFGLKGFEALQQFPHGNRPGCVVGCLERADQYLGQGGEVGKDVRPRSCRSLENVRARWEAVMAD